MPTDQADIERIELSADQADETDVFDRRLGEDLSLFSYPVNHEGQRISAWSTADSKT
jgi:hypothetical protein